MNKYLIAPFMALALAAGAVHADELNDIFGRVNEFIKAKNYTKALDELAWARKEIEKMNSGQIAEFFPDSLNGFTGNKPEFNNALGLTNFERTYTKGDAEIKLSLTGGSAGGAAGGLGGLAALGKMAAMMGGVPGQETIRIAGRTATLNEGSGNPELSVFLDSGSVLQLQAQNNAKTSDLRAMAEAIKISDLDNYLRGGQG